MRIGVLGCGYLGATHAAGMAELGHEVVGVEVDSAKLAALQRGEVPFHEPRLPQLLGEHVRSGRLRFTADMADVAEFADVHFLCVGTPQSVNDLGADLSHVEDALDKLGALLTRPALIVGKSTVPVGTAARLAERLRSIAPAADRVELAWNPEFLREGFAVQDTLRPDRLVFGVSADGPVEVLREIYAAALADDTPEIVTDLATAELVKVAANAFLATKISFINAMAEVCEATGADVVQLADAIGHDARIGRRFLNAGIGFGGGCLPKDIRAFQHRTAELGVEEATRFLGEVDDINQRRRSHAVAAALEMIGQTADARVTVLGAAFKPNSDDLRDSPALWIAGELQRHGCRVVVHDPVAIPRARVARPDLDYRTNLDAALKDAELVVHLTEWSQYIDLDPVRARRLVRTPALLDGRNALDIEAWRAAGWTVRGMGRR